MMMLVQTWQHHNGKTGVQVHHLINHKRGEVIDNEDSPCTCVGKASKLVSWRPCTCSAPASLQSSSKLCSGTSARPALPWSGSCWTPAGCQSAPLAASPGPSRAFFGLPQSWHFHFSFQFEEVRPELYLLPTRCQSAQISPHMSQHFHFLCPHMSQLFLCRQMSQLFLFPFQIDRHLLPREPADNLVWTHHKKTDERND